MEGRMFAILGELFIIILALNAAVGGEINFSFLFFSSSYRRALWHCEDTNGLQRMELRFSDHAGRLY